MLRFFFSLVFMAISGSVYASPATTCTEIFGAHALATGWSSATPQPTHETAAAPSAFLSVEDEYVRVRAEGRTRAEALMKACVLLVDRRRRGADVSNTRVVTHWYLNTGWIAQSEPIKPPDKNG